MQGPGPIFRKYYKKRKRFYQSAVYPKKRDIWHIIIDLFYFSAFSVICAPDTAKRAKKGPSVPKGQKRHVIFVFYLFLAFFASFSFFLKSRCFFP